MNAKGPDAGVEEFDLAVAVDDGSGLPDELVQAGLVDGAFAGAVDVDAVCSARRAAVKADAEPRWHAGHGWGEDEVEVTGAEAVHDARAGLE